MGGGQLQAGKDAGQKQGALFAHFHHIIAAPGPGHAQGNAGQTRAGTQIPAQGLFRQGQFLQKGRQMKAVGHQAGQDVLPGARAHQVHGRVPPAQHFQIDGQRLQSRRGYVRARGRREPGQFLSVHRLLLLHDPLSAFSGGCAGLSVISPASGTCKPRPDNVKKAIRQPDAHPASRVLRRPRRRSRRAERRKNQRLTARPSAARSWFSVVLTPALFEFTRLLERTHL